jgi:hypothetical protein
MIVWSGPVRPSIAPGSHMTRSNHMTSHTTVEPPQFPALTAEQYAQLLQPVQGNRVRRNPSGQFYLPGWDVQRSLNQIFGFSGWDDENLAVEQLYATSTPMVSKKGEPVMDTTTGQQRQRWTIVVRACIVLRIKDTYGRELTHKTGIGVGEAVNQISYGDAASLATKAAATDALKRAATKLGDQFGLSLYNADDPANPTVVTTLAPPVGYVADRVIGSGLPDPSPVGEDVDERDARGPDTGDPDGPTHEVLPDGQQPPANDPAADAKPKDVQVAESLATWLTAARRTSGQIRETTLRVAGKYPGAQQVMVPDSTGEMIRFVDLLHRALGEAIAAETTEATAAGDVTSTPAGTPTILDCGCNAAQVAATGAHTTDCTRPRRTGGRPATGRPTTPRPGGAR